MEKTYRILVLLGLLLGIVVNGIAIYALKAEVADTQKGVLVIASELTSNIQSIKANVSHVAGDLEEQLAEHERLIMDLERIVNTQLDR